MGEASAPSEGGPAGADSARAILSRVTPALAAESFERLHTTTFTADVSAHGADGRPSRRRLRHEHSGSNGLRLRVVDGGGEAPERLHDPVSSLVPSTPPYLAPRTADKYRLTLLRGRAPDGRQLLGAEATLVDPDDDEAVRRARAWTDAVSGAPHTIEVVRRTTSAIFDEVGRAGVRFAAGPDGVLPAAAAARSRVHVPGGRPHIDALDIRISEVGR